MHVFRLHVDSDTHFNRPLPNFQAFKSRRSLLPVPSASLKLPTAYSKLTTLDASRERTLRDVIHVRQQFGESHSVT